MAYSNEVEHGETVSVADDCFFAILTAIRRASSLVSSLAADRAPRLRRRGAVAPDIDATDVETAVGFWHCRDHREGRPGFDRVHVGDFISHNRHVRCDDDFFLAVLVPDSNDR